MRIDRIVIKNFRSIKEEEIIFPKSNILALVGPNNAGKSNILRAIYNILGESWFSGDRAELNDYYMKDRSNKIEIWIFFDNGKKVIFDSEKKWAQYLDESNNKIGNVKDDFPCTYLPANRDLSKNLQFRNYELMGKIAKEFNKRVSDDKKAQLREKFEEIMQIFDEVEGFADFKKDLEIFFDELQSDSPYRLKVSFKAFTPLNYFKTINILANDSSVNDEFDIDPEELGEGNKSLLLFALARSYAKNFKKEATGILAVEEPEIYLHPQARRHLYRVFKDIVKNSNIQIIYTTHSPDFVSTEEFSSIGIVTKTKGEGTKVKIVTEQDLVDFSIRTGVPEYKTSVDNIKDFYAITSNYKLNEAFFAKYIILVEGATEELCFPLLFEMLGVDYDSSGISVIGVGGKNQIPKYWRLFKSFDLNVGVVFDSDENNKNNKNNKNIATCFHVDINDLIPDSIDIIKRVVSSEHPLFVFEKDFETAFKKDFCNYLGDNSIWEKYEKEAKDLIKPTENGLKPQVLRFIINKIKEEYPKYKPEFLRGLLSGLGIINTNTNVDSGIEDDPFDIDVVDDIDIDPDEIPF